MHESKCGCCFFFAVLAIIIDFFIAKEFAQIADDKGYEGTKYGIYTFFFGIVGMLMVVALPQKQGQERRRKATVPNEKPDIVAGKEDDNEDDFVDMLCPYCGEKNFFFAGRGRGYLPLVR